MIRIHVCNSKLRITYKGLEVAIMEGNLRLLLDPMKNAHFRDDSALYY